MIGFAIGLGAIGVVAQGSPANQLAAVALNAEQTGWNALTGTPRQRTITVVVPGDGVTVTPTRDSSANQDYVAPLAQPQKNYVAPQQVDPYVQPVPSHVPQSQAS